MAMAVAGPKMKPMDDANTKRMGKTVQGDTVPVISTTQSAQKAAS